MYEKSQLAGAALGVAGQFANTPPATPAELPRLESVENVVLQLCQTAQELRLRIARTADRVIGTRPEPAGAANKLDPSGERPTLMRIESALRALRDELEGAHSQQDRIEKL